MTAAEARKRAKENLEETTQVQFDDVIDHIEIAVKDSKFSTTYYGSLKQETINRLEGIPNLFKVKPIYDEQDRCTYYEISW